MAKYIIKASGTTQGLCNPLRNLNGEEFATRAEAVAAIYTAMYDVIDGESGCDMVERPDLNGLDDEAITEAIGKYHDACRDFIDSHGYATEDGWTATIEEVR